MERPSFLLAVGCLAMAGLLFAPVSRAENYRLPGATTKPSSFGLEKSTPGLVGSFYGHVPDEGVRRVKMTLILFKDEKTGEPASYTLERILVGKGDDRHISKGRWKFVHDNARPQAVIYQLDGEAPKGYDTFWAVDDNMLLILDKDLKPRLGEAAERYTFSYTLLRTN